MLTREKIIEALKKVLDPEIRIDVWTLGLIYDLKVSDGKVFIKTTFTTPFCPYGPQLLGEMKKAVAAVESVKEVEVELTFDPPWQPSDELKAMLG